MIPTPTPPPNSGTILNEVKEVGQMVSEIGVTNSLIVLGFIIFAVIAFFGFIYLRTQTGKNAPNALMQSLITQLGHYATSIDNLTNQLINESTKGIEQRDKLIDVLNANQNVLVAMDTNLAVVGKGLETNRTQVDTYYAQLDKKLIDIVSSDKIVKGEIDIMRRFDEKLNTDIEQIKQKLTDIEAILKDNALINAADKKIFIDSVDNLKNEVHQLAIEMKNDTGDKPS